MILLCMQAGKRKVHNKVLIISTIDSVESADYFTYVDMLNNSFSLRITSLIGMSEKVNPEKAYPLIDNISGGE